MSIHRIKQKKAKSKPKNFNNIILDEIKHNNDECLYPSNNVLTHNNGVNIGSIPF